MAAVASDAEPDIIGAIQVHLKAHSKCVADTLWGIQQLKSQADEHTISRLAGELNASAAKLDRLIDALPDDFEMDPDVVAGRIAEHSKRYADRATAVSAVTEALMVARAELADKIIRSTAEETGVVVPPKEEMLAAVVKGKGEGQAASKGGSAAAAASR